MPEYPLVDPGAVEGLTPSAGGFQVGVLNADTVALNAGDVVAWVAPAGTGTPLAAINVNKLPYVAGATTNNPLVFGVITRGSAATNPLNGLGNAYIPVGGSGYACTLGHCQARLDGGTAGTATPTAGHVLSSGSSNGSLTDSGATTGTVNRTFGTVLATQAAFPTVSSSTASGTVLTIVLTNSLPQSSANTSGVNNIGITGTTGTTNAPNGNYNRTTNSFNPANTVATTTPAGTYFVYTTTHPYDTLALNLGSTIGTLGGTAIVSYGILVDIFFRFS